MFRDRGTGVYRGERMEQAIDLSSIGNARELGGYKAGEFSVKRGILLRTGSISKADEEDIRKLSQEYSLGALIDLRMKTEKEEEPDPEIPGATYYSFPVMEMSDYPGYDEEEVTRLLLSEDRMALIRRSIEIGMLDASFYETFVMFDRGKKAYRGFFQVLLDTPRHRAVLWHCTDGKDRTGVASMLLLSALGVDRETILKDYLLSNEYNAERIQYAKEILAAKRPDPNTEKMMLFGMGAVYEEYLLASIRVLEKNYGSVEAYLEQELGVGPEEREQLRGKYLIG